MDTSQNKNGQNNSQQPPGEDSKDKRIDFLKKEEMGLERDDADNAGDEGFTPIYLNSDTTLQTPGEKQHDESVHPDKNTSVEASEDDLHDTTFDRMKNEERTNIGE